jgi:hypothetical protein
MTFGSGGTAGVVEAGTGVGMREDVVGAMGVAEAGVEMAGGFGTEAGTAGTGKTVELGVARGNDSGA